jgi:hypothetical protein
MAARSWAGHEECLGATKGGQARGMTRRLTRKREVSDQFDDTPVENNKLRRLRGAAIWAVPHSPSATTPGRRDSEVVSTRSGS